MAITSLSEVAHTNSTTGTITATSAINAGDLLIIDAYGASNSSPAPSDVTPSGFTLIGTYIETGAARNSLHYKIADGTEDSASLSVLNGDNANRSLFVQFRANEPITAVTVGSAVGQVTSSNPSSKTITASSGVVPLVVIAMWTNATSGNAINPRTQSPTMTEINDNTHQYMGWLFYESSPSDQTFDMDDEGNYNQLNGAYLQLTGRKSSQFFNVF